MHDPVNKPSHYQGKVECIDAIESAIEGLSGMEAMCTGNAIKYLYRWKEKGGVEDLNKAIWYIKKMIPTTMAEVLAKAGAGKNFNVPATGVGGAGNNSWYTILPNRTEECGK